MIDLHALMPEFETALDQLLAQLRTTTGIDYRPYMGYRSAQVQSALYQAYKSGKGGRAAPPWSSPHQWGLAVDVQPYCPGPSWEPKDFAALVSALQDHPTLRSGASFSDSPHIEMRHPEGPWTSGRLAALPRVEQSELSGRAWPVVRTILQLRSTDNEAGAIQEDGSEA